MHIVWKTVTRQNGNKSTVYSIYNDGEYSSKHECNLSLCIASHGATGWTNRGQASQLRDKKTLAIVMESEDQKSQHCPANRVPVFVSFKQPYI